eukprot:TRINITY_DN9225_c0_g1_i1.p1 TRINITY_DN9225_c0_g1~~TRINITY_DN9225_c0_g1_i1.p1  ORF type:complete len:120 (+),score=43.53 TRINITY_DN9225_c0_g1_i1:45-404(+)
MLKECVIQLKSYNTQPSVESPGQPLPSTWFIASSPSTTSPSPPAPQAPFNFNFQNTFFQEDKRKLLKAKRRFPRAERIEIERLQVDDDEEEAEEDEENDNDQIEEEEEQDDIDLDDADQ